MPGSGLLDPHRASMFAVQSLRSQGGMHVCIQQQHGLPGHAHSPLAQLGLRLGARQLSPVQPAGHRLLNLGIACSWRGFRQRGIQTTRTA